MTKKKLTASLVIATLIAVLVVPAGGTTVPVVEIGVNLYQNTLSALRIYYQLETAYTNLERYTAELRDMADSIHGVQDAFGYAEAFSYLAPETMEELTDWFPISDEDLLLLNEIPYDELQRIRTRRLVDSYRAAMAALQELGGREEGALEDLDRAGRSLNDVQGTNGLLVANAEIGHHNGRKLHDIDTAVKALVSLQSLEMQTARAERQEQRDLLGRWLTEGLYREGDEVPPEWNGAEIGFGARGPESL